MRFVVPGVRRQLLVEQRADEVLDHVPLVVAQRCHEVAQRVFAGEERDEPVQPLVGGAAGEGARPRRAAHVDPVWALHVPHVGTKPWTHTDPRDKW
ncbi:MULTISPECIES: hypothetical protein [unclassified Saccharothrix]|uniref:hypothetical protein n=1 Tax=unclassified Saccharothrix TaxID=2593673 RepID=UPI00307DEE0A